MFLNNELDSSAPIALGAGKGSGIDRSHTDISGNPDITTLFSDPRQEAIRFLRRQGYFRPIT
jgi:hypothetical protein